MRVGEGGRKTYRSIATRISLEIGAPVQPVVGAAKGHARKACCQETGVKGREAAEEGRVPGLGSAGLGVMLGVVGGGSHLGVAICTFLVLFEVVAWTVVG